MARKKMAEVDAEQSALVPMSEAELEEAGRDLARKVGELKDLEAEHKESRTEQAEARTTLRGEIQAIAQTIRQQGR